MAKPSTRQELIDYSLRKLGAPVLEVNVADEQIDDLVDDTIQFFNERHFDGVERMYLKYKITQDDIDRGKGPSDPGVSGITTTVLSTKTAKPLISCCQSNAIPKQLGAFSNKPLMLMMCQTK